MTALALELRKFTNLSKYQNFQGTNRDDNELLSTTERNINMDAFDEPERPFSLFRSISSTESL